MSYIEHFQNQANHCSVNWMAILKGTFRLLGATYKTISIKYSERPRKLPSQYAQESIWILFIQYGLSKEEFINRKIMGISELRYCGLNRYIESLFKVSLFGSSVSDTSST